MDISKQNTPPNKVKWLALAAVLLLISILFYFFYWTKTPTYSLKIIHESIKNHDLATFEKHVDIDSIVSRAFDDVIYAETDNALAQGFATMMKQPITNSMKDQIKRYLETGSFPNQQAKNQTDAAVQGISSRANTNTMKLDGIGTVTTNGKLASVDLKFSDSRLDKIFILKVKMTELDNGTWRLVEIENLIQFMKDIEKATAEKLAQLNKPRIEEIAQYVTVGKPILKIINLDSWGIGKALNAKIPMTFLNDKVITQILGTIRIDNGKIILFESGFKSNGASKKGLKFAPEYQIDLNQFIPAQKELLETPLNKLNVNIIIDSLTFSDGTELKLLKELPATK